MEHADAIVRSVSRLPLLPAGICLSPYVRPHAALAAEEVVLLVGKSGQEGVIGKGVRNRPSSTPVATFCARRAPVARPTQSNVCDSPVGLNSNIANREAALKTMPVEYTGNSTAGKAFVRWWLGMPTRNPLTCDGSDRRFSGAIKCRNKDWIWMKCFSKLSNADALAVLAYRASDEPSFTKRVRIFGGDDSQCAFIGVRR